MTDACADYRPYLAALADGEADLVPPGTAEHVQTCSDCAAELATHQLLSSKLRTAIKAPAAPLPMPPRRTLLVPLAAAAAVLAIAAGALFMTWPPTDPVASAVLVADRQPQFS